jgi:group I intron endonuclease
VKIVTLLNINMQPKYCIYKLTNTLNGKGYVGFTSNFQRRLRQHKKTASDGIGQAIHAAIRKYGWEAFQAEELYVSDDHSYKKGLPKSPETKRKLSEAMKKYRASLRTL